MFHSNIYLVLFSEINGDFSRKSHNFSTLRVFCNLPPPADGVPLGSGYRRSVKKTRMIGLLDGQKSFKKGLAVLGTIPACD